MDSKSVIIIILAIVLIIFLINQYMTAISDPNYNRYLINVENEDTLENISDPIPQDVSFVKIEPNKLYYGLACNYIKSDSFYTALQLAGFTNTSDITQACLIVPCSYETTEKEIVDLENNGIRNNIYGNGIRIYMIDNTDHLVSKLAIWKYVKSKYGTDVASTMIPYSWDLTDPYEYEQFKNNFNKNKIYITKNNQQRQEGLKIINSLEMIEENKDKYLLVQELLQDPYCINGRKINLRVYVLVIKDSYHNYKVFVYRDGFMYYTPELFQKNSTLFEHNITTGYIDRKVYEENPLTHEDFRKYLDNNDRKHYNIELYYKSSRPDKLLSNHIFSQIYQLIRFVFLIYFEILGNMCQGVNFQLYGVDIAIDDNLSPMIMEVNKGPDLNAKDERDKTLKVNMCLDILKKVGLLQENNDNKFINIYEHVNINGEVNSISNVID